jgi:transglutaminase-like putative cysteine protease
MHMQSYLRATDVLDFHHPAVAELAARLAAGDPVLTVRRAFDWVRDEIRHTADYALDTVTCSASEALLAGTGYCYAKAHLFAGLCRASGIPAGLCYQRLQDGDRLVLHGLWQVRRSQSPSGVETHQLGHCQCAGRQCPYGP